MELIIFIGLQASGKSTFARSHFATGYEYISMDLLRNNKRPARRQLVLVEEALQAGRSVVVDNTNASVEARAPLLALGQQYVARIVGYVFEVQVRRSLEWNAQREGIARVPPVGIYATLKRLVPPSYKEGFQALYLVQPGQDFQFTVLPWPSADEASS